ncbi:MAG TPA: mandelate racemase/muconate lactonizing enzyme family protein [Pirellulaceae bacterium]
MPAKTSRRSLMKRAVAGGFAWAIGIVPAASYAAPQPMKITGLKAWQPPTPGSPPDWRTQLGQIIVEVQTDAGITGLGVGGGGAASIHVINTVMRDLLIGKDASQVEDLHRAMHQHTLFYGRKGLVVMATSGVDLALWDIRGKAAGLPVAKLLNPNVNLAADIPTYGTVFSEKEIDTALAIGHDSLKVHTESYGRNPDMKKLVAFVQSVRDRLGPKKSLMLDAFCMWDIDTTVRMAEALAPLNLKFLEEPLEPDDLDGYAELVKRVSIPIAGGEHEYTTGGFKELIDRKLHAVLQPDINWCGGLTTVVEVYRLAKAANLKVILHRGCEPFALHALAALDPQPLAESPRTWFNPFQGTPQIQKGLIRLTDKPGFGLEVA